uniref:Glycoside hydrolase 35 catalytic domain-containing protein n=1 Tax=Panagrolaimus sp. ES5 TaxID=591445 RepID=A0AC34G6V7_9BILA
MVQIENEYGSYNCDKKYLGFLRDLFKKLLGDEVALYTTDGPEENMMKCGTVEGVFPTVDFRPVPENVINQFFNLQQKYSKGGPMVNSEFYPGWFTMWGMKTGYRPTTKEVIDAMTVMYNLNASFTIYLMHGGTNYGFWNGAEPEGAIMTSYDWGAPISENGEIRPMYLAIQNWIKKFPNWDHPPMSVPKNNRVKAYGKIKVKKVKSLLKSFLTSNQKCYESVLPLSFEALDHPYGFGVLVDNLEKYSKKWISLSAKKGDILTIIVENRGRQTYLSILDSKRVLVDNLEKYSKKWISLSAKKGEILTIIVENRGRQTYLSILDSKGLLPNVTLDGRIITNWIQCPVNFDETSKIINATPSQIALLNSLEKPFSPVDKSAGVYMGAFEIEGQIADTWFNPGKFRKGQLFINGNNVGRYWPSA